MKTFVSLLFFVGIARCAPTTWLQNDHSLGGIHDSLTIPPGDFGQACTITLPKPVELFHIFDGAFKADSFNPQTYTFVRTSWAGSKTEFGYLIQFQKKEEESDNFSFNPNEITVECLTTTETRSVYSMPADSPINNFNDDSLHASTILIQKPYFNSSLPITINFPQNVKNLTIDTQTDKTQTIPVDLSGPLNAVTISDFATLEDFKQQVHIHFYFNSKEESFHASEIQFNQPA